MKWKERAAGRHELVQRRKRVSLFPDARGWPPCVCLHLADRRKSVRVALFMGGLLFIVQARGLLLLPNYYSRPGRLSPLFASIARSPL